LKSRGQCESGTKKALQSGNCPIIDRCNFDAKQRQTWYDIANQAGIPIDCIVLSVPPEECIRRCETRETHETVSAKEARKIVGMVKHQLVWPRRNETQLFRSMQTIRDGDGFNNALLEILNQNR
jgi:predicted kinase